MLGASKSPIADAERPASSILLEPPPESALDPGTRELEVLLALKATLESGGARICFTGDSPTVRRYFSPRSPER
jgi:hypothetical protein